MIHHHTCFRLIHRIPLLSIPSAPCYSISSRFVSVYYDLHPDLMALEAHSPGNTEARDELLQYCRENDLFFPHQDYPFDWPQHISRPSSPLPDIPDCFGSHNLIADESLQYEGPSQAYLNEILTIGRVEDDIYDIRRLTHYQIELPLLLPTAATDKLRKFGPDTLQRCVASISRIPLKDDNGLDMPKDESTIFSAI